MRFCAVNSNFCAWGCWEAGAAGQASACVVCATSPSQPVSPGAEGDRFFSFHFHCSSCTSVDSVSFLKSGVRDVLTVFAGQRQGSLMQPQLWAFVRSFQERQTPFSFLTCYVYFRFVL